MYDINYAGIVFNKEHVDVLLDMAGEDCWLGFLPFHVFLGGPSKAVSSIVSKSPTDSIEISKMAKLFVEKEIPHRLFSVPHYNARTMESFFDEGRSLVIHHRPCDMQYQLTFEPYSKLLNDHNEIKQIIVVGPHVHARKAYRLIDFWLREHDSLDNMTLGLMQQRMGMAKVYIRIDGGYWKVFYDDGHYLGTVTGDIECESNIAKVNGFVSGLAQS